MEDVTAFIKSLHTDVPQNFEVFSVESLPKIGGVTHVLVRGGVRLGVGKYSEIKEYILTIKQYRLAIGVTRYNYDSYYQMMLPPTSVKPSEVFTKEEWEVMTTDQQVNWLRSVATCKLIINEQEGV